MSEYSPSGGATSARLRQVEAELHDALRRAADLEQVRAELTEAKALTDIFVQDNQRLEAERAERVDASFALKDELDEARAEAAEMRAQLLKATEQNEVVRQDIASAMRDLSRAEAQATALRTELTAAYTRLGDTEAERDRYHRELVDMTVTSHATEKDLRRDLENLRIQIAGVIEFATTRQPSPTASSQSGPRVHQPPNPRGEQRS